MSEERFIPKEAPNYTRPFLAMMLAITFFGLWIVAGLFGMIWVVFSATMAEVLYRSRRSGS
ncbi:MAG: hypothetical protein MK180_08350 [Rhodobacteraceae bacterium]|nr:hypothetical protein [Paracoccaceae bacterium]